MMHFVAVIFYFFKQKTAYEMRISDWSSDVCSSDLSPAREFIRGGRAYTSCRRALLWSMWKIVMAIFHLSVKVISRAAGRSAVAAAAYRAGERLHDERLDRDHDFRAKSGVEHSEIMLPESAPERFSDRRSEEPTSELQ